MKNALIILLLPVLLTACDNGTVPVAFTPEMASFSNEFDFDPLRGPVKDFSQILMNDKGDVTRRINAQLSQEGCFDQIEFHNLENNTGGILVLDANYYLDGNTQEKRILLQGKCQLAEMPSAGIVWDTDDNGFIVAAHGKSMKVGYRYDSEGYPLGKTTVGDDDTLKIVATPSLNNHKKLDYTSISTLNDKTISNVTQRCDYDRYDNPISCHLQIVDGSVKLAITYRYIIKNQIEYY